MAISVPSIDFTDLFKKHERPWWISDNRAPLEGQLRVLDANGETVFWAGDMEDVESTDLRLCELIVWASRHCFLIEPIDPKEYWKRPSVVAQKEGEPNEPVT